MLTIEHSKTGSVIVLALKGRLDAATSAEFEAKLKEFASDKSGMVLDFQDLEYVSSAGLRVLITLSQSGKKVVICCMPEMIAEVFDISGLSSQFLICPNRAAGVKAAGA